MSQPIYEKGIVKVVWIDSDPERIYSKMYDSEEKAKQYAKTKKNCIVFALVKQENMKDFEWKILPYGEYKLYKLAIRLYRRYGSKLIKLLKL